MSEESLGRVAAEAARGHVFVAALDDEVAVTGPDGHHLARVRRLAPGEIVTAADGSGRWRRYAVQESRRDTLVLHAWDEVRREPQLRPALVAAVALLPRARLDAMVAPLSELGVDRLLFVRTARSQTKDVDEARLQRMRTLAREAAMQCRRAVALAVEPPRPLGEVVTSLAADDRIVVAAPGGVAAAAIEPPPVGGSWVVLTGPEGGLSPEDLTLVEGAPRLALGAHVLRAETAAVAAAAVLTQRRG